MKKVFIIFLGLCLPMFVSAQAYSLLIGSYTGPGKGKGIYTATFDSQDGTIIPSHKYATVDNPSFIALSNTSELIYSVNESGDESGVSVYRMDETQSYIFLVSKLKAPILDPCYIVASRKHIITANYSSGDISVFPIQDDGSLKEMSQLIKHSGASVNPQRQTKAHPHMILFTPDQKHLLVSDLGTDQIYLYSYDDASDKPLTFVKSFHVPKGAGPRHMSFSLDASKLFVLGELDGNIHVFDIDSNQLLYKNSTNLISPKRDVKNYSAGDIHVSPDGKYIYATLRGDENMISVVEIGADSNLRVIQNISSGGSSPRNFTISPDGAWLLVAHQNSHDVVVFRRNETTGLLSSTNSLINISAPVNLQFVY